MDEQLEIGLMMNDQSRETSDRHAVVRKSRGPFLALKLQSMIAYGTVLSAEVHVNGTVLSIEMNFYE